VSFLDNLKDALATGGDREAFMARRGYRLGKAAVDAVLNQAVDGNGKLKQWDGQWEVGEYQYTVNPTSDPEAPGGYYLSISWPTGGRKRDHTTVVFDAEGRIADCKSNRKNGWVN
jgi:hypothetical protein